MKIGFVSLPVSGHLNPMTALARKLQSRGHEIVFIGIPDIGPTIRAAGLCFVPFCEEEFPAGSQNHKYSTVAKLHGEAVIMYHGRELSLPFLKVTSVHLAKTLQETGVEAMVIDTSHSYIHLIPQSLGIPFVHIWNIMNFDFSGTTPLSLFGWPHETTPEAKARNIEGLRKIGSFMTPMREVATALAEKLGIQGLDWTNPSSTYSQLAVITQTPKEFDFPGIPWPAHFHYAGPFHDDYGREPAAFPWEKLNGKPLIYASLGTLVNGLPQIYRAILEAVGKLTDVQMVLSAGKNVSAEDLGPIPANTIVVERAPQIELLKRADLCITHAGLNTTLEALGQGVPMVAIPIGYEQPGNAARIAYHSVGEVVEVDDLTAERLAELIRKVRSNASYREKARYFQTVIARTRGIDVAADVIEEAFAQHEVAPGKRGAMAHA